MLVNKVKLLAALKARRARIVANHAVRKAGYAKEVADYRKETIDNLRRLEKRVKAAKTCSAIRNMGDRATFADRDWPRPPHRVAPTASIDKTLIELELLDESVLTVEMSRNYLSILRGDEDGDEKEYDDDEDDEE